MAIYLESNFSNDAGALHADHRHDGERKDRARDRGAGKAATEIERRGRLDSCLHKISERMWVPLKCILRSLDQFAVLF